MVLRNSVGVGVSVSVGVVAIGAAAFEVIADNEESARDHEWQPRL